MSHFLRPVLEGRRKKPVEVLSPEPLGHDSDEESGKVKLWRLADLLAHGTTQFLIDKLVPGTGVTIVTGHPNVGKTFFLIEMAMCVITGHPFAGRFKVGKRGPVVFLLGEGVSGFGPRLQVGQEKFGLDLLGRDADQIMVYPEEVNLYAPEPGSLERIAAAIKEVHPNIAMLVIDPYSSFLAGGDENDSITTRAFHRAAKYFMKELGCAVVMTQHSPKGDKDSIRGSGALRALVESVLKLYIKDQATIVEHEKSRDSERVKPFGFTITNEPRLAFLDDGTELRKLVGPSLEERALEALADGPLAKTKLSEMLGIKPKKAESLVQVLEEKGRVQLIKVGIHWKWCLTETLDSHPSLPMGESGGDVGRNLSQEADDAA